MQQHTKGSKLSFEKTKTSEIQFYKNTVVGIVGSYIIAVVILNLILMIKTKNIKLFTNKSMMLMIATKYILNLFSHEYNNLHLDSVHSTSFNL